MRRVRQIAKHTHTHTHPHNKHQQQQQAAKRITCNHNPKYTSTTPQSVTAQITVTVDTKQAAYAFGLYPLTSFAKPAFHN